MSKPDTMEKARMDRSLHSPSTMPIGKLTIELSIPYAQSLKDRRQVVRSLVGKLRNSFNLSVAELNEGGLLWNQATLAVAVVSSSTPSLTQHLQAIERAAQRMCSGLSAEIADAYAEIIPDHSGIEPYASPDNTPDS